MRALALLLLSGCSLYFDRNRVEDDEVPPDAVEIRDIGDPPLTGTMARCEDGDLFAVSADPRDPNQPGHGAGQQIGRCERDCRSAAVACVDSECSNATSLCDAEPLAPACELEGQPCGAESVECPSATTCGYSVAGSTCSCTSEGTYHCTPRTPAATTQQKLVGKWRGTVSPPSFSEPYDVSLWIYPDGTYWAEAPDTAFYYGGDGPHPARKLSILSTSATEGSWADIGIFFGSEPPNIGAVSALTVSPTTLRFTFYASWFGCGQPFTYNLTRE